MLESRNKISSKTEEAVLSIDEKNFRKIEFKEFQIIWLNSSVGFSKLDFS